MPSCIHEEAMLRRFDEPCGAFFALHMIPASRDALTCDVISKFAANSGAKDVGKMRGRRR